MHKLTFSFLILLLFVATALSQSTSPPKCELEKLAIEAALGDTVAEYNLGVHFFRGEQVPLDYAKAAILWRKASDAGSVAASNNFGFLKYYGRPGVEQDYAEGVRRWRFAAEKGFAESQVHLGEAYSDGQFLKVDLIEAYAWAKAGKHYSARRSEEMSDSELGEAISRMAEQVLTDVRKKLSKVYLAQAEKKAAEYIRKFVPR